MVFFQGWIWHQVSSRILRYGGIDILYEICNDFLDQSVYYKHKLYILYKCFVTSYSICKTNME